MQNIFDNKAIEFINLPSLPHDPAVRSSIPDVTNTFDVSAVAYNLVKSFTP